MIAVRFALASGPSATAAVEVLRGGNGEIATAWLAPTLDGTKQVFAAHLRRLSPAQSQRLRVRVIGKNGRGLVSAERQVPAP